MVIKFIKYLNNKLFYRFDFNLDKKEIIKNTSITFTLKIIGLIFSYLFNIFLARYYGAKVLGIFSLALLVYNIFVLIGKFGTQTSIVRFVAQYVEKKNIYIVNEIYKKIFFLTLILSILLTAILLLASDFITFKIFNKPDLKYPLTLISFAIPFGVVTGINSGALQGLKKIKEAFLLTTALQPFLNTIGILFFIFLTIKNFLVPIYVHIMSVNLGMIISYFLWKKNINSYKLYKADDMFYNNTVKTFELVKISLPMFMTSSMFLITSWTDTFMLGIFQSNEEVGIYRIALKIALFTGFAIDAVNSIAAPKFSSFYWKNELKKLKVIVKFSSKIIFIIAFTSFLFLSVYAKNILNIFGTDFEEGVIALIVLNIGQLINAIFGPVGLLLNMTDFQTKFLNAILIGALTNIILNYILVPIYGINGAAIATTLSILIWNILASVHAYKKFGFWVGVNYNFVRIK